MRSEIEQAVRLLQRDDDAALEQALALLQNTVFSFSMRVCGQREDAEDTMQEVLLKSVPHLPKFESPKALVVWRGILHCHLDDRFYRRGWNYRAQFHYSRRLH